MLKDEFPELAEKIRLRTPDEKDKRHGQAIAAASLPVASGARRPERGTPEPPPASRAPFTREV